jgi:hypothetical protein
MRKLIAISLMLFIFTAMAVGTAAAKPSTPGIKVNQQQNFFSVGAAVFSQDQIIGASMSPSGMAGYANQCTAASVTGYAVSQQAIRVKVVL